MTDQYGRGWETRRERYGDRGHGDTWSTYLDFLDRYAEPPTETGCRLFKLRRRKKGGYGTVAVNRKWKLAHRLVYELRYGEIPPGMLICHRCDTPACINPEHLFAGTAADNARDAMSKGRQVLPTARARGEAHPRAKLSAMQVMEIRASKETANSVAARFGVKHDLIRKIRRRKLWASI